MRTLSPALQNHLAQNATTLCHCWRLIRLDGTVLGFTDHDVALQMNGITYQANCGLDTSALEQTLGFATQGGQVCGALTSKAITERDLAGGKYDGASLEIWLVNWADTTQTLLIDVGVLGVVTRSEFAFSVEVRSLGYLLDQQQGRYFDARCDAELGDARCTVNLAPYAAHASVLAVQQNLIISAALNGYQTGWFSDGTLTFTSGSNNGLACRVKAHGYDGVNALLTLWTAPSLAIVAGDAFAITPGCAKTCDVCQSKFSNIINFQGFPHMPGNDRVFMYPDGADPNLDGSSLNI